MRPVKRGSPHLYTNGQPYGNALDGLIARLGPYCSYCEKPLSHAPEIEHVQPKDLHRDKEKNWDNLLLACKNCNTGKGQQDFPLKDWLIPDRDNTFISFSYREDGVVLVKDGLPTAPLAGKTLEICNLNDVRGTPAPLRRLQPRMECWLMAKRYLGVWLHRSTPDIAQTIIDLAKKTGFFSIWMAVFADVPAIRGQLLEAFPGTELACFSDPPQKHPNTDHLPDGGKV